MRTTRKMMMSMVMKEVIMMMTTMKMTLKEVEVDIDPERTKNMAKRVLCLILS